MTETKTVEVTFQEQVRPWLLACFGEMIAGDREERNHRFLEEALELVQACGCTAHEAHQLVDYVYGRTAGELHQEVGGVMVTLAALCLANDADMHAAGWVELDRIWGKVEAIRAKQAAKPKHSPLPQHVASQPLSTDEEVRRLRAEIGTVELTEDGLALREPFDGDVDGDGRSIIVGGNALVTFEDSSRGEAVRELLLLALQSKDQSHAG